MTDPVNWDLAAAVAKRVSQRNDVFSQSYHYASMESDFLEATARAEKLVESETGLFSNAGPARSRVIDRAGWIDVNLLSLQRLLRPLLDRLGERLSGKRSAVAARSVAAVELGTMLGWMSTRVLGQYDLLIIEDEHPEDQDIVYFIGPNVLALEKRFAFPPREFRLWLAIHEVTHRNQFTGVSWMRSYFKDQVATLVSMIDADPKKLARAAKRAAEEVKAGKKPLDDGGLIGMLIGPEQRVALQRVQGLMSLLEGHGDVVMNRASKEFVPNGERFHAVLQQRRNEAKGFARFVRRITGLEAKLQQYQAGEKFIEAVEKAEGGPLFNTIWSAPEMLPTLDEIRDPDRWIHRVRSGVSG